LIVYFLNRGYGLLTVALLTVTLPIFSSILRGIIVFRLCPVPLGFKHVDRASFRHMANYGGTTFLVLVASRLRFRTDELVLGTMISTVAVTWFNIGARIVDYAGEFVSSLAQVFVPMSSQSEATGNLDRVRKIYIAGNRVCAFLILPVTAILILFGKHIIRIWVGARYVPQSYPVLVVLIIPFALMLSQAASTRILFGLGKHQTMASITVIEGIANLILRRVGHGHPAQLYLSRIFTAPLEEADWRSRRNLPARGLYSAHSFDPSPGGCALACQPILLSPQLDPIDA